jgi:3-deoxy-D-arabino-heptulosonate 7-phosphate (DAHP) synthase
MNSPQIVIAGANGITGEVSPAPKHAILSDARRKLPQ